MMRYGIFITLVARVSLLAQGRIQEYSLEGAIWRARSASL